MNRKRIVKISDTGEWFEIVCSDKNLTRLAFSPLAKQTQNRLESYQVIWVRSSRIAMNAILKSYVKIRLKIDSIVPHFTFLLVFSYLFISFELCVFQWFCRNFISRYWDHSSKSISSSLDRTIVAYTPLMKILKHIIIV